MIGRLTTEAAHLTGLSRMAFVLAGATDGTAGFLASGACQVGQWCSTLGTTLVLRGVSREIVRDPLGRIYCHAHPDGLWLPGAASNVGGECLEARFKGKDLARLDARAARHLPNPLLLYPLARRGERFPFADPQAEGFVRGRVRSQGQLYAACLEAVAFVERWGFDIMAQLGLPMEPSLPRVSNPREVMKRESRVPRVSSPREIMNASPIFASGGATASGVWLQLRADVLNRPIRVAANAHSAKGAALLAASSVLGSLGEAVARMVHFEKSFDPRPDLRSYLDDKYARFREACAKAYPAARG